MEVGARKYNGPPSASAQDAWQSAAAVANADLAVSGTCLVHIDNPTESLMIGYLQFFVHS